MSGPMFTNSASNKANAPTAVSVGNTDTLVLAANSKRKGLVLLNTSGNTMSLAFEGAAAVLASGLSLTVATGALPGFKMDEYTFTTGAVHAIASAGSSNLSVQEWNF